MGRGPGTKVAKVFFNKLLRMEFLIPNFVTSSFNPKHYWWLFLSFVEPKTSSMNLFISSPSFSFFQFQFLSFNGKAEPTKEKQNQHLQFKCKKCTKS